MTRLNLRVIRQKVREDSLWDHSIAHDHLAYNASTCTISLQCLELCERERQGEFLIARITESTKYTDTVVILYYVFKSIILAVCSSSSLFISFNAEHRLHRGSLCLGAYFPARASTGLVSRQRLLRSLSSSRTKSICGWT